jgi:hypothetical protein
VVWVEAEVRSGPTEEVLPAITKAAPIMKTVLFNVSDPHHWEFYKSGNLDQVSLQGCRLLHPQMKAAIL